MSTNLSHPFRSVYEQVFDAVVFGGGCAGFAAAGELRRRGRAVLLVDRSAALLWESGWAFSLDAGEGKSPQWRQWMEELKSRGAATARLMDGAVAEVVATDQILKHGPKALYYVTPVAIERDEGGLLRAVAVAGKAGVRWIRSRQWIDATDTGELIRLIDPSMPVGRPVSQTMNLFYRHEQWRTADERSIPSPSDLPGGRLTLRPTVWPNERCLSIELPGEVTHPRLGWLPAMQALRDVLGDEMKGAVLTHASVVPLVRYATAGARGQLPGNVVWCGHGPAAEPWTLSERFERGLGAVEQLESGTSASATDAALPEAPAITWREQRTEVAVAGVGTGGALAAIAAGRAGAKVTAFDPLPFAGGIGSGGGIHYYYFGIKGGLQEELDQRVRDVMPLFGSAGQLRGFHPDAKKVVLDQMLLEVGVELRYQAALFGVERAGQRVMHAHVATSDGAIRLAAEAWLDATGDGDLAAYAGARFRLGRSGDGQLHAYTQSSGRASAKDGEARMMGVNFDAGFVDPTDEQDLTRGRLVGIAHYLQQQYTPLARPTYIAPAIGLRQGRHIETEYVLTLADLIERRVFPDAIGLTGAHYDNHSVDYEFESSEAVFWVWACQQWRPGRTACEIPYRILLPRGLDNVLLACRAAGVSEEAHPSFRMQRDMQRIGEAAGYAAAVVAAKGLSVRDVPLEQVRQRLEQTGAMKPHGPDPADAFGPEEDTRAVGAPTDEQVSGWIEQVRRGAGLAMWHLYRHEPEARAGVESLSREEDPDVSWRAATILATWGDPVAEERLCQAIARREYGFEQADPKQTPEQNNRLAPRWLAAAALLRRCGTAGCLSVLHDLARDEGLLLDARAAIATTIEDIASRRALTEPEKALVAETLAQLHRDDPPNRIRGIQQHVVKVQTPVSGENPTDRPTPVEDCTWQLHLAIARAEQAAGLPVHAEASQFITDPRSIVRRAFRQVLDVSESGRG